MRRLLILPLCVALCLSIGWTQQDEEDATPKGKGAFQGKGGGKGGGKGKAAAVDESAAKARAIPPLQVMQLVKPGMYLVQHRGANAVFQITNDGVILVNTKSPGEGNFERLLGYIQGVTKQPVKVVENTGAAPEYTGNNDRFQAIGATVRPVKNIVVLDGVAVTGELDTRDKVDALLALEWDRAVTSSGQPLTRAAVVALQK